jgi:hypothetical protein
VKLRSGVGELMTMIKIKVSDNSGHTLDMFDGQSSDAPPIPRLGELLSCLTMRGTVVQVEHQLSEVESFDEGNKSVEVESMIHIRIGSINSTV